MRLTNKTQLRRELSKTYNQANYIGLTVDNKWFITEVQSEGTESINALFLHYDTGYDKQHTITCIINEVVSWHGITYDIVTPSGCITINKQQMLKALKISKHTSMAFGFESFNYALVKQYIRNNCSNGTRINNLNSADIQRQLFNMLLTITQY